MDNFALMSKKTRYHRHGGEIHIEVTEEGKLTEHVCIGCIDENRPDYQEHTKLIVRACNNHDDLLKACKTLRDLIANKVKCTNIQLEAAMLSAKIAIAKAEKN